MQLLEEEESVVREGEEGNHPVLDLPNGHVGDVGPKTLAAVRGGRGTVLLCGHILVARSHDLVVRVAGPVL